MCPLQHAVEKVHLFDAVECHRRLGWSAAGIDDGNSPAAGLRTADINDDLPIRDATVFEVQLVVAIATADLDVIDVVFRHQIVRSYISDFDGRFTAAWCRVVQAD